MFDGCIILDMIILIVFGEYKKLKLFLYIILTILLLLPLSLRLNLLLRTFLNILNLLYQQAVIHKVKHMYETVKKLYYLFLFYEVTRPHVEPTSIRPLCPSINLCVCVGQRQLLNPLFDVYKIRYRSYLQSAVEQTRVS
jgi:hypothetical protein